jgi:tetratricopeptide (TPR) repeat protein
MAQMMQKEGRIVSEGVTVKGRGKMNLENIAAQAVDLYIVGGEGHDTLVEAFEQIEEIGSCEYPLIAYKAGHVYIVRGDYGRARIALDCALKGWQDIPKEKARVLLALAFISLQSRDVESVQHFVDELRKCNPSELLIVESGNILAELYLLTEPDRALEHFDKALRYYNRIRHSEPKIDFEIARIATRAAHAAFRLNMPDRGEDYIREANQAARRLPNNEMMGTVFSMIGESHEAKGYYDLAIESYNNAAEAAQSIGHFAQRAHSRRARVELARGNDQDALRLLTQYDRVDDITTLLSNTLLLGWMAAFNSDFKQAEVKLRECETLIRDDHTARHEANLLRGFLAIYSAIRCYSDVEHVRQAAAFFLKYRMEIDSSRAHLILAWLLVLHDDEINARAAIYQTEESLRSLGHARHVARLYEESAPILGTIWSRNAINLLEDAVRQTVLKSGTRVFAFGVPSVYSRGEAIRQQAASGKLNVKLLIYMLEKRHAEFEEIVEAVWDGREPQGATNRFHRLSGNLKESLGAGDWVQFDRTQRLYVVRDDFPDYYDAREFNREYEALLRTDNVMVSLTRILKILKLYDTFARTLEGEAFESLRRQYDARYEQVLNRAEQLLPQLADRVPSPYYESIIERLNTALDQ